MTTRTDRAVALLLAGLLLGVAGDVLRAWVPGRLDFVLWATTFLLVAAALVRTRALTALPPARSLAGGAVLLLPCLLWRDSEVLFALNLLGLGGLLVVAGAGARIVTLQRIHAQSLVRGGASLALSAAAGPLPSLFADVRWSELPFASRVRRAGGVALGLGAAVPALVVLGALLRSADPLFGRTLDRFLFLDLGGWEDHLVAAGIFSWLGVGLLRGGFWREGQGEPFTLRRPELPPAAIVTFTGAIGSLLLLFVLFQVGELFLSAAEFQRVMGMTIAEYARQGFFELAWVAGLTLPLLTAADWCLDRRRAQTVVAFHRLSAGVVALLVLILASAFHRMTLYEALYGLTELRFYTLVFMAWLGGVLGWFAATVLRGRRSRFVPGALAGAYGVVLALNVASPDRIIAEVNLRRGAASAPVDGNYLATLSADAVPVIARAANGLAEVERCAVLRGLEERWRAATTASGPNSDWNLSRRKAAGVLRGVTEEVARCETVPDPSAQGTDAKL
ncbi:MAG TPA: DUF4173 domain-containing protein [Gemmatimonadales bacterium]|nr:DUF4173 domain-containing protein [Gemmatimonadales bacterium]